MSLIFDDDELADMFDHEHGPAPCVPRLLLASWLAAVVAAGATVGLTGAWVLDRILSHRQH